MIAPPPSQQPSRMPVESDEDSDSDWDEDEDFVAKKINIRIKPVSELAPSEKISASADELRASMGTWKSMANVNLVKPNSRRSMHQSSTVVNKMSPDSSHELSKHRSTHINTDERHTHLMQPHSTPAHASALHESPIFTQHSDTHHLKPVTLSPLVIAPTQMVRVRLPVAIATQECLHVRISGAGDLESSLVGHIKMAVPCNIVELSPEHFRNNDLAVQIVASRRWSSIRGDKTFSKSLQETCEHGEGQFGTAISVNMGAIYDYATRLVGHNLRPYFLLPELATYTLKSRVPTEQEVSDENQLIGDFLISQQPISPVRATTHWLCGSKTTKVRTDIEFLTDLLQKPPGIQPCDVRNVIIDMQVDGNVVSHESRPQASWDPIHSRLSWSFSTLQELLDASTNYGVASCLAKLVLSDGPSKPRETNLQFSIIDKTMSNLQVSLPKDLNPHLTYKLAKHKQEVKTGTFRCEPQF